MEPKHLLVQYPDQPYTQKSIESAIKKLLPGSKIYTSVEKWQNTEKKKSFQWSDYDLIDWDHVEGGGTANAYVIRKALIRKNHLAHTLLLYTTKKPESMLAKQKSSIPSFYFKLSFPDELDELLADDLWELGQAFEEESPKWWILKAALADKGNGIRLFQTREQLEEIFEEFSPESESEEEEEEVDETTSGYNAGTRVNMSHMSEWVIQEYVVNPLLFLPSETYPRVHSSPHKFHLRVYVVAYGGLKVYTYKPYLALFAPKPYHHPSLDDNQEIIDLAEHLTNTCLQSNLNEQPTKDINVHCFQHLVGTKIASGLRAGQEFTLEMMRQIEEKVNLITGETFRAGVSAGSGFQPLPECFEIFGFDYLVDDEFNVYLLEINVMPDFTQTGPDLQSIVDKLFENVVERVVIPHFNPDVFPLPSEEFIEVLDIKVGNSW